MNRLLLAAAMSLLAAAGLQAAEPVTIMPIGDSLTDTTPGYRGPLLEKLRAAGFDVKFVGPKKADPNKPGSTDHAGHGGFTIGPGASKADEWTGGKGNIYVNVDKWLTLQPNIVLLLIGTNDYFNIGKLQPGYSADKEGAARLGALLDKIHEVSPKSLVLVSSILPVGWNKEFAKPINEAIPGLVATRPWTKFVDLAKVTAFTKGDWSPDNLHPSEQGYEKIAAGWFDALAPILKANR